MKADKKVVDDLWSEPFGRDLFNLYTTHGSRPRFYFSARARIVKAMLAAMLEAEREHTPRDEPAVT